MPMQLAVLPGKRYLLRELMPRWLLLTVTFKYVMPVVPFSLFHFPGGLLAAIGFGLSFTAMFCVFGAYIMGSPRVVAFIEAHQKAPWLIAANVVIVLGVPAAFLALAAFIAPASFAVSGLAGIIAGSVILNIACALTHDYGAR